MLITKLMAMFSHYTLRKEGNKTHLVTFLLHCFHTGHRQMEMVPPVLFAGFCLCTKVISGHRQHLLSVSDIFSIRRDVTWKKEWSSSQALLQFHVYFLLPTRKRKWLERRLTLGHLTAGALSYITLQVLFNL